MYQFRFIIRPDNDPELVAIDMTIKHTKAHKAHNVMVSAMRQLGFKPGDYRYGVRMPEGDECV